MAQYPPPPYKAPTQITPVDAFVPIKSAWLSKINWTQFVAGAAMIATIISGGKVGLSAEQQAGVVTVIGVIGNLSTIIFKTFYTGTVTPSSAAGIPPGGG